MLTDSKYSGNLRTLMTISGFVFQFAYNIIHDIIIRTQISSLTTIAMLKEFV